MAGGIRIRHVGTEFTVTWRDRDDVVVVTVHEGSVRIGDGPRARLLEATRAASFTIVERLAMERETPPPAPAVDLLRCMHEAQDAERANSINESIGILQACGRGVQAGMPLGAVLFLRLGALLEANHNREGARIAYVRAKELAQNRDEEQSAETAIRRMNSQGQH